MARRNKARRYGRDDKRGVTGAATHVIKIGFNAAQSDDNNAKPGKLNGFCIYRDTLNAENKYPIDYALMERLGYSKNQVDQAHRQGFKADDSLLPGQLHCMLMADARRDEHGDWEYPGVFAESYECYNKQGLFCSGDGCTAHRKQNDGSKKLINCVPYGRSDADPATYCEFSGPGKPCKDHCRLTVCLLFLDADGRLRPLAPELGAQAIYRFDTSSEYGAMGMLEALDACADRVQGHINGLTGTLAFQRRARRTGGEKFSKSTVGHVILQIHEEAIRHREAVIRQEELSRHNRLIEAAQVGIVDAVGHAPQLALPMDNSGEKPVVDLPSKPAAEPETASAEEPLESEACAQVDQDDPYSGLVTEKHRAMAIALESLANHLTETSSLDFDANINIVAFGHPDGLKVQLTGRQPHWEAIDSANWFFQAESQTAAQFRLKCLEDAHSRNMDTEKSSDAEKYGQEFSEACKAEGVAA